MFAFYKSQGGTQALRRRLHGDERQRRGVHLAGSVVLAADADAVRVAGEVDVADHEPLPARGGQSLAVPTYKFKYQPENGPLDVSAPEPDDRACRTVASATAPQDYFNEIWNIVANMSYVTGSHNLKFGVNHQWGYSTTKVEPNGDMSVLTYHEQRRRRGHAHLGHCAQHAVHRARQPERESWASSRRTSGRLLG